MEQKILNPQPTEKNPYIVEDYPWGFKKCKARFYVESVKKKGDRFVKQTQNPKTLLWCKPKKSTYSAVIVAVIITQDGRDFIKSRSVDMNSSAEKYKQAMETLKDFEFNDIQKEKLKVMRAYIKAYEGVTFECVEMTGKSEEEIKEHENGQDKIMNHINNSVAVNYANDTGSL